MDANAVLAFGLPLSLMLSMTIEVWHNVLIELSDMSLPTSSACFHRRSRFHKDGSLTINTALIFFQLTFLRLQGLLFLEHRRGIDRFLQYRRVLRKRDEIKLVGI